MNAVFLALWVRSMVLGCVGLGAIFAFRRSSASVRHAVAICAMGAILALPVLAAIVRPTTVAELPATVSVMVVPVTTSPSMAVRSARMPESLPDIPNPEPVNYLLAIWLAGVAIGLARMGYGLARLRGRIRKSVGVPVPAEVVVMADGEATVPMTAWWGKHRIFLPEDWQSWSDQQLDTALRHEQAHIRRGDWFTRIGGQLIGILFWPNPLVWLLHGKAKGLAEQAADDLVLSSGVAPWRYAQDLLQIARRAQAAAPAAAIAMADKAEVARRIEMVLEQNRPRRAVSPAGIFTIALAVTALAIPLASWAAQSAKTEPAAVSQGPETKIKGKSDEYVIVARVIKSGDHMVLKSNGKIFTSGRKDSIVIATLPEDSILTGIDNSKVVLSPTIVTRDGQPASIQFKTEKTGDLQILAVEPHSTADGKTLLVLSLDKLGGITVKPVKIKFGPKEEVVVFKPVSVKDPNGTVVILRAKKQPGKQ